MCGCLSKRYRRRHMLTLENLSFGVQDEKSQKEIIRNLNLTIESNKFVVVTGPNGGGKSTLAKLIAGIDKPTDLYGFYHSV